MDESLFLMIVLCSFVLLFAIIYCFLSTCLGIQIRRSDIWEAFTLPNPTQAERERERRRRRTMAGAEYELDDLDGVGGEGFDRLGGGMEGVEMMRRSGPGRGFF